MKSAVTAMVVVALLMVGTFGGTVFLGVYQPAGTGYGVGQVVDFDGDGSLPGPDGIPGGDPEHPQ